MVRMAQTESTYTWCRFAVGFPIQKKTLKHTTQVLCARVVQVNYTIDINTFEKFQTDCLQFNEVGEVQFELHNPIFCDRYAQARTTGNFIVIDSFTSDTVAAGMVEDVIPIPLCTGEAKDDSFVGLRMTQRRGLTVWFTGLSGAGKTTICRSVATELLAQGLPVEIIDGDFIRGNLCRDLGFSREGRMKNIRRIALVSQLLSRNGTIVFVAAISPYRMARDEARKTIGDFIEVSVSAQLAVCEPRDSEELYRRGGQGNSPDLRVSTTLMNPRSAPRPSVTQAARAPGKLVPCGSVCSPYISSEHRETNRLPGLSRSILHPTE
jgi:adenylyl-sulfate kinase